MKEQRQMLRLLRFSFWGEADRRSSWPASDWPMVLQLAERQSVHGLVAKTIADLNEQGVWGETNEDLTGRCLTIKFALMRTNLQVNGVLEEIVGFLQANGQQPMLVKGQGVAQCYPVPELRMPGDIDLYLKDVDGAARLLQRHYSGEEFSDSHPRHFVMKLRGIDIELHRYLLDEQQGQAFLLMQRLADEESHCCQKVSIGSVAVDVPSPLFHAVFLFCHFRAHFLNDGIGLRQVCDWMWYLHTHHDEIDEQRLKTLLNESGLLYNWQCFGSVAVDYLGLPASEFPCYGDRHRLMSRWIMKEILYFGHQGHECYRRWRAGQSGCQILLKLRSMAVFTDAYLCNLFLCPRKGWSQLGHFYLAAIRRPLRNL